MTRRVGLQTAQDETVGRTGGHPWGDPVAANEEFRWPPTGRFPWPPSLLVNVGSTEAPAPWGAEALGTGFLPPPHGTWHAVLTQPAHRRPSPPAFGYTPRARRAPAWRTPARPPAPATSPARRSQASRGGSGRGRPDRLARLEQVELQQLPGPVERAPVGAPDQVARPHLAHVSRRRSSCRPDSPAPPPARAAASRGCPQLILDPGLQRVELRGEWRSLDEPLEGCARDLALAWVAARIWGLKVLLCDQPQTHEYDRRGSRDRCRRASEST